MGAGHSRTSNVAPRRTAQNGGAGPSNTAAQPNYQQPQQFAQPQPFGGNPYGFRPSNNGQFYGGFPQQQQYPQYPGYMGGQGAMQQSTQQPPRAVEQTQRTTTIRNHVNVKKNSVALVCSEQDKNKVGLKFTFDANIPCWASVFVVATEEPANSCALTQKLGEPPRRTQHPQGLGQTYQTDAAHFIDLSKISTEELTKAGGNTFPVVIRMECITAKPKEGEPALELSEQAGAPLATHVQSQTTYAKLKEKEEGGFDIQVVKQKIWVDDVSYELQEIFGIENCSTGQPLDDESNGKECVVCLSEPRDTTVLPCRHMCMCSGCARMLRHQSNRCPICRTPVESLLEIKVAAKQSSGAESAAPST